MIDSDAPTSPASWGIDTLFASARTEIFGAKTPPAECPTGEQEALDHWSGNNGEIVVSDRHARWLNLVQAAAVPVQRLYLLPDRPSAYQLYTLDLAACNVGAGEEVRIGRVGDHPPLKRVTWIVDRRTVYRLHREPGGRIVADETPACGSDLYWAGIAEACLTLADYLEMTR